MYNIVKNLKELSEKAALALLFEPVDTPQVQINILNSNKESTYTITVPKLFLEEFARLVINDYHDKKRHNTPLDPLKKRITNILILHGVSPYTIEYYIDDIFAFSDRALYEEADDQTIISDFEDWLED